MPAYRKTCWSSIRVEEELGWGSNSKSERGWKGRESVAKRNMVSVEEQERCGDRLLTVEGLEILLQRVIENGIVEIKRTLSRWVRNSNGNFKLHIPYLERNKRWSGRWKGQGSNCESCLVVSRWLQRTDVRTLDIFANKHILYYK